MQHPACFGERMLPFRQDLGMTFLRSQDLTFAVALVDRLIQRTVAGAGYCRSETNYFIIKMKPCPLGPNVVALIIIGRQPIYSIRNAADKISVSPGRFSPINQGQRLGRLFAKMPRQSTPVPHGKNVFVFISRSVDQLYPLSKVIASDVFFVSRLRGEYSIGRHFYGAVILSSVMGHKI